MEYFLRFLDAGKFNIAESLGSTSFFVGRQAYTHDFAMLTEFVSNEISGGVKCEVGDEEGG